MKDKILTMLTVGLMTWYLSMPTNSLADHSKSKNANYVVTNATSKVNKLLTPKGGSSKIASKTHKYLSSKRYGRYYDVWATKYNATINQCDGDPFTTADLSKIDKSKLHRHELKWIAVSRDLLNQFRMGDIVEIKCDNEKLNGEWEIHDLMNKRFSNRIDFLVPLNDKYEFHKPMVVKIRRVITKNV